jgi:hypothetical protein
MSENPAPEIKNCQVVHELEHALSFVTEECPLVGTVEVSEETRDGKKHLRVTCKEDREYAEKYLDLKD